MPPETLIFDNNACQVCAASFRTWEKLFPSISFVRLSFALATLTNEKPICNSRGFGEAAKLTTEISLVPLFSLSMPWICWLETA